MTTINRNTFLTVKPTTIKQTNPLDYKIVFPYVCAIYSLAVDRGNLFQITRDFKNGRNF